MTATDELRAMLNERGMEYETYTEPLTGIEHVKWNFNEHGSADFNIEFGAPWLTMHGTISGPAQAIEATLGPREQPPYDELIEALRRDWDMEASWDGLRRFWYVGLTDEGVRKRDEREATLGRGECHNASNVTDKHGQARFVCSACGAWLDSRMLWNPEYPNGESPFVKDCRLNFCPNCGRKVVEE